MSTEVDLIKKLIEDGQIIEAVEVPVRSTNPHNFSTDLEDTLTKLDNDFNSDDVDFAHFVVRVKRTKQPLVRPLDPADETPPLVTIDTMVQETFDMTEQFAQERKEEEDPKFLLENAALLEENQDFELARSIYLALIKKGLMIAECLSSIARTYDKEGQIDKAIQYFQEAIAYSSNYQYHQALGALYIRSGNDELAAQTLLHALGLSSLTEEQTFEIHKSLGNCYTRLGEFSKAEHHYRKAYELNADSDVLQVNVGSLALQKADYASAQKHFSKAIELNPANEKAISGLGMVYVAQNQTQNAYDHFVSSLKINHNNLGTIYNLVKCSYELKKFDDAAKFLKLYIDQNQVNSNILYSYAGILFHQNSFNMALDETQKILNANPHHAGAKELEALIKMKLNSTTDQNTNLTPTLTNDQGAVYVRHTD